MKNNQRGVGALIIIIIVLVIAIIGGAGYLLLKRNGNVLTSATTSIVSSAESKKAFDDCKKEYNDDDLCKALSNFMGTKQYQTSMTMSGAGSTAMTYVMEVDNDKTYIKNTIGGKSLETITIGNTTYTKDNTDGKWWKQVFETTKTSTTDDFKFDTNIGDTTNKTAYTKIGEEPCDKLTCIKYKISESSSKEVQYVWFDTKDHLIRKLSVESSDGSKYESTYSYNKKSVDAPSNTKDASPTQSVIPADFYSGVNFGGTSSESSNMQTGNESTSGTNTDTMDYSGSESTDTPVEEQ